MIDDLVVASSGLEEMLRSLNVGFEFGFDEGFEFGLGLLWKCCALGNGGLELIHEFAQSLLLGCGEEWVGTKSLQDDQGCSGFDRGVEFGF